MNPDADLELIRCAIMRLMEHFDTIQVFATRATKDGTEQYRDGAGNYFARVGQVKDWIMCEEAVSRDEAVRKAREASDDE